MATDVLKRRQHSKKVQMVWSIVRNAFTRIIEKIFYHAKITPNNCDGISYFNNISANAASGYATEDKTCQAKDTNDKLTNDE